MTVLIVDGDSWHRALVKRLLEKTLKVTAVVETGRGGEGIRLARELGPSLVLVDIAVLHGDGFEAIRSIKAERPETRVVVLTQNEEQIDRAPPFHGGVDAFLPKEILTDSLLCGIRSSVLRRAGPRRSAPRLSLRRASLAR